MIVRRLKTKLMFLRVNYIIVAYDSTTEKGMAPTPVFLPGEPHGQRSLAGYSPWGHEESDTTEQLTHIHNALLYP